MMKGCDEITSNALAAASEYDKRGWILHPLTNIHSTKQSPGKKPILNSWQNRTTNTHGELNKWFDSDDLYNVGLVCGKASDIIVVDVDHKLFEDELFSGIDIDTLKSSRTKGRGHLYFKYTDKIKSQKHHDLGFEILSNGSNAVLPPSKHISGEVYRWKDETCGVVEFPDELIQRMNSLIDKKKRASNIIGKCRTCFKTVWDKKPDLHGANGREMMLAFCTELKANGAELEDILFISKLIYQEKFDAQRTELEFRNSDKNKPWKCETLVYKFPTFINCDGCNLKPSEKITTKPKQKSINNTDGFKIINEPKFLALKTVYDGVKISDETNNGSHVFRCADTDFLDIALKSNVIERCDYTCDVLPIISTINDLMEVVDGMDIKDGKGIIYYVNILGKTLQFDETELLVINKWREKLLAECKMVMGLRSKNNRSEFDEFVASILNKSKTVWKDDESDDDILTSIVLEEINKLILVDDKISFKRNDLAYFIEGNMKLVKSSTIHQIMRNKNISITFRKLREIMRPMLADNSKQISINGSLVSVWFFEVKKQDQIKPQ